MGKKALERKLAGNEAKAITNRLRISPRKLNLVAGMIRGMSVSDALVQLQFSGKRIANDVRKTLQSAVANAENNHNLDVDSLYVKEVWVGQNIVMKRFHTRGRGRSAGILKPFANLTLIVAERGEEPVKKQKTAKKESADKGKTEGKSKPAPKTQAAKKAKSQTTQPVQGKEKKESK